MKAGDLLFVYGTLRLGASSDLSRNPKAAFVAEDHINGRIYDLGWFPGVKAEPCHFSPGEPTVVGDVFLLQDEEVIAALDRYEGYPDLYSRIETETAHGRHVWVYVYNHNVTLNQWIESGDWLNKPQNFNMSAG